MTKTRKIIYWVVTIFLSVGMLAGGIQQMLQIGGYNEIVTKLGYPLYILSIIGTWKILGVIAILVPKFRLLKEWAYAGFFFVMTGAAISHWQSVNHLPKQCRPWFYWLRQYCPGISGRPTEKSF